MAYNTTLEEKIDAAAARWRGLTKKKMFGGICYLLRERMCFGIWKDFLIVRMDKAEGEKRLGEKNTKPFDITGRPMAGWVMVNEDGWKSAAGLGKWLAIGKQFAGSLPEKKEKKKRTLRDIRG